MSSDSVLHQIVELKCAEGWNLADLPRRFGGKFFLVENILLGIFFDTGQSARSASGTPLFREKTKPTSTN